MVSALFTKRRILLGSYYLPGIVALARVLFTLWILIWNPMKMPLPFIQLIPAGALIGSCFGHFKLYRDAVPVISLMASTFLHIIIIFVFMRVLVILPFLPVLILDVLYLVIKAVKANLFPFYLEGDEDDEYLELDDISEEAG